MAELLTKKEVAKMLRVSDGTIANWVRSGKLKAISLPNGRKRFNQAEITKFLAELSTTE